MNTASTGVSMRCWNVCTFTVSPLISPHGLAWQLGKPCAVTYDELVYIRVVDNTVDRRGFSGNCQKGIWNIRWPIYKTDGKLNSWVNCKISQTDYKSVIVLLIASFPPYIYIGTWWCVDYCVVVLWSINTAVDTVLTLLRIYASLMSVWCPCCTFRMYFGQ